MGAGQFSADSFQLLCRLFLHCKAMLAATPVIGAQMEGLAVKVEGSIGNTIGHAAHNAPKVLGVAGLQSQPTC